MLHKMRWWGLFYRERYIRLLLLWTLEGPIKLPVTCQFWFEYPQFSTIKECAPLIVSLILLGNKQQDFLSWSFNSLPRLNIMSIYKILQQTQQFFHHFCRIKQHSHQHKNCHWITLFFIHAREWRGMFAIILEIH